MKTILLPFFDDPAASAAFETASVVAERFGSHVEGLFILRPPQIFDGEGIALAGSYLTQIKEEGRRLADSARARFEALAAQHGYPLQSVEDAASGASAEWREIDGLEGQVIGDHGRLFDLVVVARGFGHPWLDWNVVCEAALFESGRPVLVAPTQPPARIGERVVVAWNGSTETARAIGLARPYLEVAERITVLTVEGGTVPGPTGEEVAAHLRRNGMPAEARTASGGDRSNGEAIVEEARNLGADLIVKGAYTHSRLRQMVFGGATRHLLQQGDLPVLMVH